MRVQNQNGRFLLFLRTLERVTWAPVGTIAKARAPIDAFIQTPITIIVKSSRIWHGKTEAHAPAFKTPIDAFVAKLQITESPNKFSLLVDQEEHSHACPRFVIKTTGQMMEQPELYQKCCQHCVLFFGTVEYFLLCISSTADSNVLIFLSYIQ